mmetsp:Transcript_45508/g.106909  ORF Transcript_45508/g.106909 Transcript_45508/m.106909 type:complete len:232 (-) Transcript_45508:237-932(-)
MPLSCTAANNPCTRSLCPSISASPSTLTSCEASLPLGSSECRTERGKEMPSLFAPRRMNPSYRIPSRKPCTATSPCSSMPASTMSGRLPCGVDMCRTWPACKPMALCSSAPPSCSFLEVYTVSTAFPFADFPRPDVEGAFAARSTIRSAALRGAEIKFLPPYCMAPSTCERLSTYLETRAVVGRRSCLLDALRSAADRSWLVDADEGGDEDRMSAYLEQIEGSVHPSSSTD